MEDDKKNNKKPIYRKWWFIVTSIILAFPILIFEIACLIVCPPIFILEIPIGVLIYCLIRSRKKQKKEQEEKKEKEKILFRQGYRKVYDDLYINEENKKLNILGKDYAFSQIIECELIENNNEISNSYGKIKKTRVHTFSTDTNYCNELYINITVEDLENPNIKLNVRGKGILETNGEKYKKVLKNANNILSLLKIIISKNNEKYIETGTVTKIEHRYITEETVQDQIKKLSELYKDGILTEYEYNIKKMELLEKIK